MNELKQQLRYHALLIALTTVTKDSPLACMCAQGRHFNVAYDTSKQL